jgi:hypothetical protein
MQRDGKSATRRTNARWALELATGRTKAGPAGSLRVHMAGSWRELELASGDVYVFAKFFGRDTYHKVGWMVACRTAPVMLQQPAQLGYRRQALTGCCLPARLLPGWPLQGVAPGSNGVMHATAVTDLHGDAAGLDLATPAEQQRCIQQLRELLVKATDLQLQPCLLPDSLPPADLEFLRHDPRDAGE